MSRMRELAHLDRRELVDLGFGAAAMLCAVVGFRATFAGNEELLVGVPAVLFGLLVGAVIVKLRLELLPGTAAALLAWVLAGGGLAIRSEALFGVLPTPGVLIGLADGLVSGWIRLLTTVPPAGEAGNLLTIPYAAGYLGAVLTVVAAWRWRGAVCLLVPLIVLGVALLFGTRQPAALLVQGVLLVAVTLAWAAVRDARRTVVHVGRTPRQRLVAAGVVVAVIATASPVLGSQLPGADPDRRFVLREQIVPPFDPLSEPSPLAGYRRYTDAEAQEQPILDVDGLPPGVPIRLAVLDDYDGLVWRASGRGDAFAGRFVRAGETFPDVPDGALFSAEVQIHAPHGVWLPTVGELAGLQVADDAQQAATRVNLQTGTVAVPGGVAPDTTYQVEGVIRDVPDEESLAGLPLDPRYPEPGGDLPNELVEIAAQLRGTAEAPYARIANIAAALRTDGAFSDGGAESTVTTPPGHSLARLARFLGAPQWVGNGEQYAAALGLLAAAEGIPARVVMGFEPEQHTGTVTVTGGDVAAWVEVPLDGVGWVPVRPTPPEENEPDPTVRPQSRDLSPEPQPPPPPPPPTTPSVADDLGTDEDDEDADDESEDVLPSWLGGVLTAAGGAGLLIAPFGAIVLAKRTRRSRRRTRGPARLRAHGGWLELLDRARDYGTTVPAHATRREAAALVGADMAPTLAGRTDDATFNHREPTDDELDALWRAVDETLAEVHAERGRLERLRAAINPVSLWKGAR